MEGLAEGCIAAILCRTTPVDACRLSLVSKTFRSAAESDTVWEHFLPSDSHFISLSPSFPSAPTKKALYLALSDHPIIIDNGRKSIQLDIETGKKCYMLSARSFTYSWRRLGHIHQYLNWTSMPESRFLEVVEILNTRWLEFRGMINTLALSPDTRYGAYLVFERVDLHGLRNFTLELSVGVNGGCSSTKFACLDPDEEGGLRPSMRSDGRLEIEIGEFSYPYLKDEEIYMSVSMTHFTFKISFFLEGIEVRPK